MLKIFRILTLIVSIILIYTGYTLWKTLKGPTTGGDFTVTYRGIDWTYSNDAKKINLLYFGYTKCPDVCPMSLNFAGQAFKQLSVTELKNIRFLFLSVDHAHDNPDDVANYAMNFFPTFVGLSGSQNQIDKAIGLFPAGYIYEENKKSYLGYSISHTDRIFFLDSKGLVLDSISGSKDGGELLLRKIKEYL